MNTSEFLTALEQRLGSLPQEERSWALSYFDELFTDMMQEEGLSQEEAVARLEPVETIAARILEESPRASQREVMEQEGVIRTLEAKTQGIRNIKVAARDMPIRVQAGEDDRISIRYPVDEHTRFDITTQGGELALVQQPWTWRSLFSFHVFYAKPYAIDVYVPREVAAAMDLTTSNALLHMEDIALWGSLLLQTSNAAIQARNISASQVHLKTSNGKIVAEKVTSGGSLEIKTSNARVEAKGLQAEGALSLVTSNGKITCSDIQGDDITLKTSNSNIKGVLPGAQADYQIDSATSNGKNSLAGSTQSGHKRLSCHTSNANINVAFAQ